MNKLAALLSILTIPPLMIAGVVCYYLKATPPLMLCVFACATLGSIVNETGRYRRRAEGRLDYFAMATWKVLVSIVLSSLLYLLFASHIVQGPLFPTFTEVDTAYSDMGQILDKLRPHSIGDATKLCVWSFIAGYSEKFVPGLVDSITKSDNSNPPPAQPS